ncbi:uncharacterized protein F5Z01DRAFT_621131 [Emericellopsis atlantica]|uniref:PHD-type domain-containing protein n=1 Tax=Emericellopsis atlantica TaxID=2614577 RepID=A0A9P7ZN15_9HYPO|nr:uncharacterized protein F5Z01DRAFT_621131 [Emericellopsis atlantica]KAG9254936.1 hypothetical protein F5Z01DRAFT_621131 [Emericellopsis atlantica]
MISANSNRSMRSRFSSPAQGVEDPSTAGKGNLTTEGSRSIMDKWLEPAVQNKASHEEAGLARHGVLEGMVPLGSLPKARKTEPGSSGGVRRIILKHSNREAPSASETTAAAPAHSPVARPALPPLVEFLPPSSNRATTRKSLPTRDTSKEMEEDDEYEPRSTGRRRSVARPAPPKRGRPPTATRRSSMPSSKDSPVKQLSPTPPPLSAQAPARLSQRPPSASSTKMVYRGTEFVEKVIEAAVDEALSHHRYPTAWALRTFYDDRSEDPGFVRMVEEIFNQTADASTRKSFFEQLARRKHDGRYRNQGRDYFVPPADDGSFEPHLPKKAPYAHLILHKDHDDADHFEPREARAPKRVKPTHRASTPAQAEVAPARTPARTSTVKIKTPASRRRARKTSHSSESSLSSVEHLPSPELPDDSALVTTAAEEDDEASKPRKTRAKRASTAVGGGMGDGGDSTSPAPRGAGAAQPINTRRKALAASKQHKETFASASVSASNSPTTTTLPQSPTQDFPHHFPNGRSSGDGNSMPGLVSNPPGRGNAKDKSSSKASLKIHIPLAGSRDDAFEKRKIAKQVTNSYRGLESAIRDADDEREMTPVRSTRKTRQSTGIPPSSVAASVTASARATRSAKRTFLDELDQTEWPSSFPSAINLDGRSSTVNSRAATPTNLRPAKKQKSGLRIKSSPQKKKGGTAAGVPRTIGEAQAGAYGASREQGGENDEYCSACGNAGEMVCCDGCPRAFHFECVGINPEESLPDEWYCSECLVKGNPTHVKVHRGAFGPALNQLDKSIHRAFALPRRIQERFDGVRAGPDGEYEEVVPAKPTNNGYEEAPDYYKQIESGEPVLCHDCQLPASEGKPILSCTACPLHWHMDCMNPPLAVPPLQRTWKCPAHLDDALQEKPPLAPAHRWRKVKGAPVIIPALSRGLRNNGHIELDWGSEPEADAYDRSGWIDDQSGWKDVASFGRTFKVSATGVRLDFIEQLRTQGAGFAPPKDQQPAGRQQPYLTPPVEDITHPQPSARSIEEMQASLVLSSLSTSESRTGMEQLISALVSEADSSVLSSIADADAVNIANKELQHKDKASLRALLAHMERMGSQIRAMLGEDVTPTLPSLPDQGRSVSPDKDEEFPEMKHDSLVTEPTPPSTIDHEGGMDLD